MRAFGGRGLSKQLKQDEAARTGRSGIPTINLNMRKFLQAGRKNVPVTVPQRNGAMQVHRLRLSWHAACLP
jgi:hypothetical protein